MANESASQPKGRLKTGIGSAFRGITAGLWATIGLILLILAAAVNGWLNPLLEQLPTDYVNKTKLLDQNRFRDSLSGDWQTNTFSVDRIDQTISSFGSVNMIEGSVHAYFANGDVNFESSGLYGVDRSTRLNLPGYGDTERSGYYLFSVHTQPISYTIWDPMFIGPRQATFVQSNELDGLAVYVFSLSASGLDETAGYDYLQDVPEHYRVHTDMKGTAWVEPVSGIMVDYEDDSVSYFVEPASGARLADFNQFVERFAPETIRSQLKLARDARLTHLLLGVWLPGGLTAAGLASLALAGFLWLRGRPLKRRKDGAPA